MPTIHNRRNRLKQSVNTHKLLYTFQQEIVSEYDVCALSITKINIEISIKNPVPAKIENGILSKSDCEELYESSSVCDLN